MNKSQSRQKLFWQVGRATPALLFTGVLMELAAACGSAPDFPNPVFATVESQNCKDLGSVAKAIELSWSTPDPWPTYDSRNEVGSIILLNSAQTQAYTYGLSETQAAKLGESIKKCENLDGFLKISKVTTGELMNFPKEGDALPELAYSFCHQGSPLLGPDEKKNQQHQKVCSDFHDQNKNYYAAWIPESREGGDPNASIAVQNAKRLQNTQYSAIHSISTAYHEIFHLFQEEHWKKPYPDKESEARINRVSEQLINRKLRCSEAFEASLRREFKWWDAGFTGKNSYTHLASGSSDEALRLAQDLLKIRHERSRSDDCQYFYEFQETNEGTAQWVGMLKVERAFGYEGDMRSLGSPDPTMPDDWYFGNGPWYSVGPAVCTLLDLIVPNHSWQLAMVEGWSLQQTLEKAVELKTSSPGEEIDFKKILLKQESAPRAP